MRLKRLALAAMLPFGLILSGCDTEDDLLQQQFDVLKAEEVALQEFKETLSAGLAHLEGPSKVSIFVSDDVINGILKGADDLSVPVPDVKGATITVKSIRADFKMGYPLLNIDATATKEGIDAQLSIIGVARLIPTIVAGSAGKPSQLELRMHVDSLVPRAQWGIFDFKMYGFVRDLLQAKLNDELRTAGIIRMPLEAEIPLTVPAKQTPITFTGANALVSTPDLSMKGKASINQFIVLPDGLHVYGQIDFDPEV